MTRRPQKKRATAASPAGTGRPLYPSRSVTKALETTEIVQRTSRPMGLHRESTALTHLFANHIEVVGVCECLQTVRMGNTAGRCFSAAVRAPWGETVAAISISVPMIRLGSAERSQALIAALKTTSAAISRQLAEGQSSAGNAAAAAGKEK